MNRSRCTRGRRVAALAAALILAVPATAFSATVLLLAPAAALATGTTPSPLSANPLSGLPAAPVITASQTATLSNTATNPGGSSLSSSNAIAIATGAVIVLGGIALFIWRDARRRAPVRATAGGADAAARQPGSKRPKPRKLSAAEKRRRKRGRAKPRR